MAEIDLVDVSIRDGNQSLWGATGLHSAQMLEIAGKLDRAGFRAIDFTSSTHMAVAVRYFRNNPWERIRRMRAAMPRTPLQFITTGLRFIAWQQADPEFMRLVYRRLQANGIRRFIMLDPMHDPDAVIEASRLVKEEGGAEVMGALTFTLSDVHDDAFYADFAGKLAASPHVDLLYLKDPSGLMSPERVRSLAPAVKAAIGNKKLEIHAHCTIGYGPVTSLAAADLGYISAVHVGIGPLGDGSSLPEAGRMLANLKEAGHSVPVDEAVLGQLSDYWWRLARAEGLPPGRPQSFDASFLRHQIAGGVMTTTKRQLDELKLGHLFPAVIEETERVRAELGHPIMVTPFPQMVMSQALFNVIGDGALRPDFGPGAALRARQVRPADQRGRSGDRGRDPRPAAGARDRAGGELPGARRSEEALRRDHGRGGVPAPRGHARRSGRCHARRRAGAADLHARGRADPEIAEGACGAAGGAGPGRRAAGFPAGAACGSGRGVKARIAAAKGFIFDMDGTIALGDRTSGGHVALPGAIDLIARIKRRGIPIRIFTNGTAKPPAAYAASLRGAGFDVTDEEMMTPSTSAAAWLTARKIQRVRVLGNAGTAAPLVAAGIEVIGPSQAAAGVEAVYTGWHRDFTFHDLEAAVHDILAGAIAITASNVPFFATAEGRGMGTSYAMNAVIRAYAGRLPKILGKPSREGFLHRARRHGAAEESCSLHRRGRRRSGAGDAHGQSGRRDFGRRRDRAERPWHVAKAAGPGPAAAGAGRVAELIDFLP